MYRFMPHINLQMSNQINTTLVFSLQLGGFVEKYAGSGVSPHTQSSSNKENRRTEGLNRYLQALQSNQSSAPGQRADVYVNHTLKHIFVMHILITDMWHYLLSEMRSYSVIRTA